jgi:hypothetical protein
MLNKITLTIAPLSAHSKVLFKHGLPALQTKASVVKKIILNDQLWKHASIVVVDQPICELLDFTNAEVCC